MTTHHIPRSSMPAYFSSFLSRNTHSTMPLGQRKERVTEPFFLFLSRNNHNQHHIHLSTATTTCPPHSSSIHPPPSDADELKVGWMDEENVYDGGWMVREKEGKRAHSHIPCIAIVGRPTKGMMMKSRRRKSCSERRKKSKNGRKKNNG